MPLDVDDELDPEAPYSPAKASGSMAVFTAAAGLIGHIKHPSMPVALASVAATGAFCASAYMLREEQPRQFKSIATKASLASGVAYTAMQIGLYTKRRTGTHLHFLIFSAVATCVFARDFIDDTIEHGL